MEDNFRTVAQFAALKGVSKMKIYSLIEKGEIVPVMVAGKQVIDLNTYSDYDAQARIERVKSSDSIKDIKKRLAQVENVVFGYAPGEGKRKKGLLPSENH